MKQILLSLDVSPTKETRGNGIKISIDNVRLEKQIMNKALSLM